MEISPYTRPVGLIGHPVKHSLSPKLHNRIYSQIGLDMVYLAFDVSKQDMTSVVEGMRAMKFQGFNVTIPYKKEILKYLDDIDPEAEAIGAVNTVKIHDRRLTGYNTDGMGFIESLKRKGIHCAGKNVAILGAGGSAHAIGVYLAREGSAQILVMNRTDDKAKALCNTINEYAGFSIAVMTQVVPRDTDIVINTTPLGMWPKSDQNPLKGHIFKPDTVVCDIVYNPRITRFLREAANQGCSIVEGTGMLVSQGIKAIEIWTGRDIKIDYDILIE